MLNAIPYPDHPVHADPEPNRPLCWVYDGDRRYMVRRRHENYTAAYFMTWNAGHATYASNGFLTSADECYEKAEDFSRGLREAGFLNG